MSDLQKQMKQYKNIVEKHSKALEKMRIRVKTYINVLLSKNETPSRESLEYLSMNISLITFLKMTNDNIYEVYQAMETLNNIEEDLKKEGI